MVLAGTGVLFQFLAKLLIELSRLLRKLVSKRCVYRTFLHAVLQVVNEMFKKALVVLMDEFKPLADSVATMMIEMYETTPHASILDVARQVRYFSSSCLLLLF